MATGSLQRNGALLLIIYVIPIIVIAPSVLFQACFMYSAKEGTLSTPVISEERSVTTTYQEYADSIITNSL